MYVCINVYKGVDVDTPRSDPSYDQLILIIDLNYIFVLFQINMQFIVCWSIFIP